MQRRSFFTGAATAVAAATTSMAVSRVAMAALPEPVMQGSADTAAPLTPPNGRPYQPVVTLNGWTTPWRMNAGVKEFHLVAEPVVREVAPGFFVNMWGYNGQSPGPTIEVVEGDKVRIFVTNRLPESTTIHWHGQRLPNGMDGVGGLNQPHIPPGKTFVYEFEARRPGTFMYHPHSDEMVQMAMGMMGLWITHPKTAHPLIDKVQRDYAFLLSAYAVEPGTMTPRINEMTDFNIWTFNSRAFPAISPLVARQGDKVRIRVGNLTMTNHPIHIHGHEFEVTGTDGGPVPKSARWPEVTTGCGRGPDAPGGIHCRRTRRLGFPLPQEPPHHGRHGSRRAHHDRRGPPRPGGQDPEDRARLHADGRARHGRYGRHGDAAARQHLPHDDRPGPFGPIEMGGMFTSFKVRKNLGANDYGDPGWYQQPKGTRAYEWQGAPFDAKAPARPRPAPLPVPPPYANPKPAPPRVHTQH
jgi:hypothetical protein